MLPKATSSLMLALFLLGSSVTASLAQTPAQSPRRVHRQEILEQLNLTDQQKQQIANVRQKHRPEMEALRKQIRANQEQLQTLMAGSATEKELRAQHQKITELRQEMANISFESMLEIRQVLTPAQRTQLAKIMKERPNRRQQPPESPPPDDL